MFLLFALYAVIITILILAAIIYFTLIHKQRQLYNAFRSQNIPGEPFVPIFGQLKQIRQYQNADKSMQWYLDLQAKHGNLYIISFGPLVRLIIIEPEYASDVLKKYTKFYVKPAVFRNVFKDIMGENNLLVSAGENHNRARKMLNPAFHFVNLQSMISIMTQQTACAIDKWLNMNENNIIDLQVELNSLTLSVIASSAFGQAFETNEHAKNVITNSLLAVLDAILYRTIQIPVSQIPFLDKLPILKKDVIRQGSKEISAVVEQMINDRKAGISHSLCDGNDLLDLLLTAQDQDGNGFSDQQVRDEAITFVLAGHETTGNLLVWCMYLLMAHPDVYRDCYEEIERVLQGKIPVYSQLTDLHILDAVIHESLRLYPPAPVIVRECVQEHSIGPDEKRIRVPVGATILLNIFALHRSNVHWKDPSQFNYKRWMRNSDGLKPKLAHPFCYLPFSAGNRNCIGQNFAMLESKVILAMLIQRLHFELVPGQKVAPQLQITLRTKYGLYAKVNRIL
ncbi:unnamed protein product [Didymodactylos carnosus]|uniref:Cytochrome P450 n=1 Tax=Didymodactylos carnosus TaxID=1234261 RepID=A0A814K5Q8_9BILA|nr:unnamed protein product [Didymodactylos carnosus]CAF1433048.1 unnamed protein product [Didymodactylos carnosus]CAF3817777.1 unnamed protein product [Didymodactylos carnosus]CAF4230798.1 unnamed protein product [Didymodactylos carnosus]